MANLKDVAKKAEVSTATVSYVINNTRYVSDELRSRVLAAIKELDYHPNSLAKSLRSKKPLTVGLVVSNLSSQFYADVVGTSERLLYEHGYSLLICNSGNNPQKERHYFSMLASRILAGIIIAPSPGCSIDNLAQRNLPVVAINRDYENNSGPMVYIDNRKKAYECVRHLIEVHGYRDIASVMVDLGASNVYDRYLGYCDAMAEHQLPTSLFITREYNGGQGIIRHMAEQKILPEALFIGETQAYLEVLRGLKENDISCPEDIALIGFSDSVYNAYIGPPLSALQNPGKIIAETAVRELLELIGGGTAVRKKIIIDVDIDFRESCGCGRAVR